MPDWTFPMEGGCRCGAVRVEVSAPPLFTAACHCLGCQKMSASAFSMTMMIPMAALAVTRGETELGGMRREARHHFCGACKSWMFTTMEMMGPFVNLRPSMLDDHRWFAPFADIHASTKLPWVETGAPRAFPEFPAPEEFEGLLAGYAAWAAAR